MFSYSALHGTLKSLSLKVPLAVSLWAAHSLLSPSLHLQSDPLPCLHWLLLQAASGTCHPSKQPQSCSCFFFVLSLSPPAGPSVIIQPKASQENDFSVSFGKWDALSQSPHWGVWFSWSPADPLLALTKALMLAQQEQTISWQPWYWAGNQNFWSSDRGNLVLCNLYSLRCQWLLCQDLLGTYIQSQQVGKQRQDVFDQSSEVSGPHQHSL